MDIKLKRYNVLLKAAAFVLIVISSCLIITLLHDLKNMEFYYGNDINAKHYIESTQYRNDTRNVKKLMKTFFRYVSKENIQQGNTVTQEAMDSMLQDLYDEHWSDIEQIIYDSGFEGDSPPDKMMWDTFRKEYKPEIDRMKSTLIEKHLRAYERAVRKLSEISYLKYYVTVGEQVISNAEYSEIVNGSYSMREWENMNAGESPSYSITNIYHKLSFHDYSDKAKMSLKGVYKFDHGFIAANEAEFLNKKKIINLYIFYGLICLLLFLLGTGYLIFAAGKRAADPQVIHMVFIDKLYNEITAVLLFLSGWSAIWFAYAFITEYYMALLILFSASVLLSAALTLSLVRKIKNQSFFKHFTVFSIFCFPYRLMKKGYNRINSEWKVFFLVLVFGLFTAVPFAFFVTIPLALIFTYHQVKHYIILKNGIRNVKSGIYNQKIDIRGEGELAILADDIRDISAGLGEEVERRLKSERLKTELIINISHDIRTPLTSVITYIDLLGQEDIDNENAGKYIDIIASKSARLNTLIDDLFDAAKAASGNIPVTLEDVDISSLITQGLGELNDKITASSLEFKINLPEDKITAYADGKLLWRVLENLFSNVFKYSLAGSRVYVDVTQNKQTVFIEIKNISASELNIPEDELMERFKRGDESRSSEGNGLGLSIAKSLMQCQNGELILTIDGDLFKAALQIPKK